jgi:hypothetical protein
MMEWSAPGQGEDGETGTGNREQGRGKREMRAMNGKWGVRREEREMGDGGWECVRVLWVK